VFLTNLVPALIVDLRLCEYNERSGDDGRAGGYEFHEIHPITVGFD
jgi:hypothetical protein